MKVGKLRHQELKEFTKEVGLEFESALCGLHVCGVLPHLELRSPKKGDLEPRKVAARPAAAELPSDAAFLADTKRSVDAEHPEDAAGPTVSVRDPEARAWPPAPRSYSRCQLLYGLGALVVVLLVSGLIAFFTLISTLPALIITTSSPLRTLEKTPNLTGTHVPYTGCPNTTGQGCPVFAKLQAKNQALLENRTLSWHSQSGAGSSYLSQGLRYDKEQQELVVDKAGLYFVVLQLKLSPVSKNMEHEVRGQVSLVLQLDPQVDDLDSSALTVDLSPCSMEADLVEGSWSDLILLKAGHRLSVNLRAYLHGAQEAYKDWQLSQTNFTSFVLFRVEPDTPRELSSTQ
ncbi:tumor necrosis factor ligand superfamily member 9 isoform X2 [Peromyscus californicus insignis]|uniref:tumor necrosis factor ligand superfamily member 9 isoform X2 n=1 Tax=Peromyscus californicus insignis TaxID=564181 RepID=UPI0022A6B46C|nr:tumor necrosis factor ligand superfamily member 9 isoform X2 [Peromyscus californicus insignis]